MARMRPRDDTLDALLRSRPPDPGAAASTSCPSVDLLAARYERNLSTDETTRIDRHLASCSRCRQVIAALARTEPARESSGSLVGQGHRWRWLVPSAAALAATAILWTAVDPTRQIEEPERTTDIVTPREERPRALAPSQEQAVESRAQPLAAAAEPAPPVPVSPQAEAPAAAARPPRQTGDVTASRVAGADVRWRLSPGSQIERSRDGGFNWQPRPTGVPAELLAISAPSGDICWAVGREGVILRTVDGSTWSRVESPTDADLVGVAASSDLVTEIDALDGARFRTENAGASWTPLP